MSFFFNPFGDDFGGFGGFPGGGFGGKPKPPKDVDTTKYYKVLGVEKTCSQEELRKAYRKLVKTKHPDKGGDEKEFQEIQQAYDTLSDENKRKVYDEYGEEGIREGRDGQEPSDIFDIFTGGNRNKKKKTKSVLQAMDVSLEDIYKGKEKYLEISRYRICKKCKGSGSKNPNANTKCTGCNGRGVKMVVQRMGNTILQSQQTCPECRGEGYVIKENERCTNCKGAKVCKESKTIKILLDKGAPDGKRYVFEGESDEMPDYEPGDVVIEIHIKKHSKFERKGADLTYVADISLLEALTGFKLLIKHLDDREILISSKDKEIIKPGMIKTVKDCGMPFFEHPTMYGNLYIKFNIKFPKSINEKQNNALQQLFPKIVLEIKDLDKIKEKYTMTEYNENDTNKYATGGNQQENGDDDDDGPRQGQAVRCENQ